MRVQKNDGINFKYSWKKALMDYPAEIRLEVYDAILEYAESGTLIELKPMAKMAFSIFKVEIDSEKERQKEIASKRAEAGKKGMESRYNKTNKPQQNITKLTNDNKTNNCYNCYDLLDENPPIPPLNNNILYNNQDKKETTTKVVEKKKEKSAAKAAPSPIEKRKKEFYETLRPFIKKYPPEMLRKFYDYWSEMNKSGTKMRFELERTWEVSKRLATWAGRDDNFNKSSMEIGTVLHNNNIEKYQNEEKWNR